MHFAKLLVDWYYQNKRKLPWRDIQDPYKIWLSEIMLQQTRIQQVYHYYERFINQWKTIHELAYATEEDILKAWEGLGYYSRARHLHQTAKIIAEKFQGNFPSTYQELEKLPGIGSYTARAIASFAFEQPVVSLDGNAFRVITRILDIDLPIHQTKNQKIIQQLANNLLQEVSSKDFNYALMDLGNIICKPQNPLCSECPVQSLCLAYQRNTQNLRPVKTKNLKRSMDYLIFYWIEKNGNIAITQKMNSYWKGLYVLPYKELNFHEWKNFSNFVIHEIKHVLTHKDLYIKIVKNDTYELNEETNYIWVNINEMNKKAFPKPLQNFIVSLKVKNGI